MPAREPRKQQPKRRLIERWRNWRAFRTESALVRTELKRVNRALSRAEAMFSEGKEGHDHGRRMDYGLDNEGVKEMNEYLELKERGEQERNSLIPKKEQLEQQLAAIKRKYGY